MTWMKKLIEDCRIYKQKEQATRRFKLTVGTEELRFHHKVIVETMIIGGRSVLHMGDERTHFQAISILKSQSAAEIWKRITNVWICTYLGASDYLAVDQGSAFVSKSKETNMNMVEEGIILEEAPIDNPGFIVIVERYHAPLRSNFDKLRQSLSKGEVSETYCLKISTYATNSTICPEGLCPMMLVLEPYHDQQGHHHRRPNSNGRRL